MKRLYYYKFTKIMFENFFLENGTKSEYKPGDVIVDCGQTPTHVYFLESGYVKASVLTTRGNEHLLIFYKAGEIFPARWAFTRIKGSAFYTAVTPIVVRKVPKQDFTDYLLAHPNELLQAVEYTTLIMDVFVNRVNDMAHLTAYLRLTGRLLSLLDRFGKIEGEGALLELPITHHDLASSIAMSRETVSRELSKLEKKGLIEYRNQLIFVPDVKKMKNEVGKISVTTDF